MNAAHIHVGPGKLGLGHVVFTGVRAGLPVFVVHAKPAAPKQCGTMSVIVCRDGVEFERVELNESVTYCAGATLGELDDVVRAAITGADHVLLTTALGAGPLETAFPLLREICAARPAGADRTTVFIPCENNPGTAYPEFAAGLRRSGVDVRGTMVNRLCYWHPERPEDDENRIVYADTFIEWAISGAADNPLLDALDQLDWVRFEGDVDPSELRKRLLVNGTHLGLALLARESRQPDLNVAASEPGRSAWLKALQATMATVLDSIYPGLWDEHEGYSAEHREVWTGHDDKTSRVLSRLRLSQLGAFFDDIDRKLGQPARRYIALTHGTTPEIDGAFTALHKLLLGRSFEDMRELRRGEVTLPEGGDEATVERYRTLITGIVDNDIVDERVAQLTAALAKRRDELKAPEE